MDVAVIVPMFNGARWICQALDSVFSQSQAPAEVVIVDDGSTDGSRELVKGYPGVILLQNPGKGANTARNYGANHTRSPLVAFHDQDDVWHADHLQLLCDILKKHQQCHAAVGSVSIFASNRQPDFQRLRPQSRVLDPWSFFPFDRIDTPSAVLIRRDSFLKCGQWSLKFPYTADYYMWLRLSVCEPLRRSMPVTVGRRLHEASFSLHLRTQGALEYLAEKASASDDVLAYRSRLHPEEVEKLRRRMGFFEAAAGILRTISHSADDRFTEYAWRLEQSVSGDDADIVQSGCDLILWLLEPILMEADSVHILATILEHWPVTAPRTRSAMRQVAQRTVSYRAFIKLVRAQPGHWRLWILLANVLYQRTLSRIRRSFSTPAEGDSCRSLPDQIN